MRIRESIKRVVCAKCCQAHDIARTASTRKIILALVRIGAEIGRQVLKVEPDRVFGITRSCPFGYHCDIAVQASANRNASFILTANAPGADTVSSRYFPVGKVIARSFFKLCLKNNGICLNGIWLGIQHRSTMRHIGDRILRRRGICREGHILRRHCECIGPVACRLIARPVFPGVVVLRLCRDRYGITFPVAAAAGDRLDAVACDHLYGVIGSIVLPLGNQSAVAGALGVGGAGERAGAVVLRPLLKGLLQTGGRCRDGYGVTRVQIHLAVGAVAVVDPGTVRGCPIATVGVNGQSVFIRCRDVGVNAHADLVLQDLRSRVSADIAAG